MIPKIIHFCWFGGNPLPSLALECIASWRKYLPDYEIWMWSESYPSPSEGREMIADRIMRFDVYSIPYTAEAYKQKKYAFVSDYCRFVAMYEYGGIYFDTDVEVIRQMDDIIAHGNFLGFEVDPDGDNTPGKYAPRYCFAVNPGVGFGFEKNHPFIKLMIDLYHTLRFEPIPNNIALYKTIVAYTTEILCQYGLDNKKGIQEITIGDNHSNSSKITIYPHEYFAPIDVITGKLHIACNTHTIHRYMGSWNNGKKSWKDILRAKIPSWVFYMNNRIKRHKYRIKK